MPSRPGPDGPEGPTLPVFFASPIASDDPQTGRSLGLVAAREMVESAIEELPDLVIEFLDAVQLEREELVGDDATAGKVDQAVLADIAAQVVLGDHEGVDQLADLHALAEAGASHF